MSDVHVLFENESWMPPLREALAARGLTVTEHTTTGGTLDLNSVPPDGVWINRMSPSSHTRGHQGGVIFLREFLHHLEAHGRRVINGSNAFALELSKVRQDLALRRAGIRTPHTLAVVGGPEALKEAARTLPLPFITKHNQGGKGLGVQLFESLESFDAYIDGPDFEDGIDGITLLQQYIRPREPFITRVEIVAGEFQYAIQSSTEGGFELCPAVECVDAKAAGDAFCPIGGSGTFQLAAEITDQTDLVQAYIRLMRQEGIDVAGIEFVEDSAGNRYTYDINGTTNYNAEVEAGHGQHGMDAIADLVAREVAERRRELAAK
jgi:glutathione synthase/RimK-type ligase-like ATP-grasp enzyme